MGTQKRHWLLRQDSISKMTIGTFVQEQLKELLRPNYLDQVI